MPPNKTDRSIDIAGIFIVFLLLVVFAVVIYMALPHGPVK